MLGKRRLGSSRQERTESPAEVEDEDADWKAYFKDDELEKAYTYYKQLDQHIIKEEEIESDKSKDSCSTSEDDLSDLDDLSERDLKENVYMKKKPEKKPEKKKKLSSRKKSKSRQKEPSRLSQNQLTHSDSFHIPKNESNEDLKLCLKSIPQQDTEKSDLTV